MYSFSKELPCTPGQIPLLPRIHWSLIRDGSHSRLPDERGHFALTNLVLIAVPAEGLQGAGDPGWPGRLRYAWNNRMPGNAAVSPTTHFDRGI